MTDQLQQIVDTLAVGISASQQEQTNLSVQTAHDALTSHITTTYPNVSLQFLELGPESTDVRRVLAQILATKGAVNDIVLGELALSLKNALTKYAPDTSAVVGIDLSNISAKSLNVEGVQSDGIGVRIDQAEITEDASIRNVTAGNTKEHSDNASTLVTQISHTNVGRDLIIGEDKAGQETAARQAYLREVASECNLLPWKVVHTTFADPDMGDEMGLAAIYTDLDTTGLRQVEREEDLRRMFRMMDVEERLPVQDVTNDFERLLLMGDPGSGKSTFVKHLAYILAQAGCRAEAKETTLEKIEPWSHGILIPVRVELRQVAAFARLNEIERGDIRLLRRYMNERLDEMGQSDFKPQMDRLLQGGKAPNDNQETKAIFLLDGLDEVPTSQRQLMVDMVNELSKRLSRHRYLVTCRPYAYVGQPWQLINFHPTSLAPFNREQIERFVVNWYRRLVARGRMEQTEADNRLLRLRRAADDRSDLLRLAERPLLLTVMTQLHTFKNQLPDSRVELYQDAVNLLLQRWEARNSQQDTLLQTLNLSGLTMADLQAGLFEVAYNAHAQDGQNEEAVENETADISEGDLRKWLAPYLQNDWNKAGEFIDYIRERTGLLIRHKTDAYTFPHRTFQEYLAACYLVDSDDFPTMAAELVRSDRIRWREVFVLAAGQAPLGQAIAAVNSLVPRTIEAASESKPSKDEWQTALVAGEAICEIGQNALERRADGQALIDRVRISLVGALTAIDDLQVKVRVTSGLLLGRIGDPRLELMTLAKMRFCYVPAGPFRMGRADDDDFASEYENPIQTVDIDYGFWIGQAPITNAQFAEFATEENYHNPIFWKEAAAAGRWDGGTLTGQMTKYDPEKHKWERFEHSLPGPFDHYEPWTLPNHPRVYVNWYEAVAFCRWLTQIAQANGWLPADHSFQLLSEVEWEKAARGGQDIPTRPIVSALDVLNDALCSQVEVDKNPYPERFYPWGNQQKAKFLNYSELNVGHTTSAGCFGSQNSLYGIVDMVGNIVEWTRSVWEAEAAPIASSYHYENNDNRSDLTGYVLRSGSWVLDLSLNRTSSRFGRVPGLWRNSLGFRVVAVPFNL